MFFNGIISWEHSISVEMTRTWKYLACLVAGLMCCSFTAVAQFYRLSGFVRDAETHQAISHANISIAGSRLGGTSGEDGRFSVVSDTLPVNLIVSHVSYKTRRIWVEEISMDMTIWMETNVTLLQEVEVTGVHQPYPYFSDDKYTVLDYRVDQGLVYLLVYKFRRARAELLCQTLTGDTLLEPCPLSFKPNGLFLDCMGFLHILSKDSIYQVYMGKESLSILYRYNIERFHNSLENCMVSTGDVMYFRKQSPDRLTVDFYRVDRHSRQQQALASVRDEKHSKILRENPADYRFLVSDRIPDGRNNLVEYVWVRRILYKPNKSVMHQVGDSLCLFNVTDGTVEIFDLDGQFVNKLTLPVDGKVEGVWTKEIYIDLVEHVAYTSGLKNGILTLYQVDLQTGKLYRVLHTIHTFPDKVSVYDHSLYYLYDVPGESDNRQLMRQRL